MSLDTEAIRAAHKQLESAVRTLNGCSLEWHLNRLLECKELLLTKYAPFKVGDRVMLTATPDINQKDSWGWMGAKHFLIRGAVGTVREVDVCAAGFRANVEFDDESWLPDFDSPSQGIKKGVPQPVSEKHVFGFNERHLVVVPTVTVTEGPQ